MCNEDLFIRSSKDKNRLYKKQIRIFYGPIQILLQISRKKLNQTETFWKARSK